MDLTSNEPDMIKPVSSPLTQAKLIKLSHTIIIRYTKIKILHPILFKFVSTTMGLAKAVIKFVAIPIILVVFIAFIIIVIRSKKQQKKLAKQAEAETLPQFNYGPTQTVNGLPAKPDVAVVHQNYVGSYDQA